MNLRSLRRRMQLIVGPLIGASAVAYFGYHIVQGDRGLLGWWHLRHEIAQSELILLQTDEIRASLERRVALLHPESLDRDLLEERARIMLNMGHQNETVILTPGTVPGS